MQLIGQFKRDPRFTLLPALLVLLIYNFTAGGVPVSFILPIIATVAVAAFLELALFKLENRPFRFPLSAVITGTIISIVLTPSFSTLHLSLAAVLIALLAKRFLKINAAHVFNPANFGSLVISFLQPTMQSWWATSNPLLAGVLGLIVVWRINGWFITLPFLAATALLETGKALVLNSLNASLLFATVFGGTILFFATVMLVEPMTTPVHSKSKVAFGIIAALLNFAFSFVLPTVSFLAALTVSNVLVQLLDSKLGQRQM